MTPAIKKAQALKLNINIHEYHHDPQAQSFGLEAAEKLGVESGRVFKTLVASSEKGNLCVALVPVMNTLSMKKLAKAFKVKKCTMAEPRIVENSTGYIMGGVSPLGQKKRLPTYIDESASTYDSIFISAGQRGLEIEIPPEQLAQAVSGLFIDLVAE